MYLGVLFSIPRERSRDYFDDFTPLAIKLRPFLGQIVAKSENMIGKRPRKIPPRSPKNRHDRYKKYQSRFRH